MNHKHKKGHGKLRTNRTWGIRSLTDPLASRANNTAGPPSPPPGAPAAPGADAGKGVLAADAEPSNAEGVAAGKDARAGGGKGWGELRSVSIVAWARVSLQGFQSTEVGVGLMRAGAVMAASDPAAPGPLLARPYRVLTC